MSGPAKRYGVRIRPAGEPSDDARAALAATIAPIIGQPNGEIEAGLASGAHLAAVDQSLEEAEQFAEVLTRLGALAQVVVSPDDADAPVSTWAVAMPTPPGATREGDTTSLDAAPSVHTQPFDGLALRALMERPTASETQPIDIRAVPRPPDAGSASPARRTLLPPLGGSLTTKTPTPSPGTQPFDARSIQSLAGSVGATLAEAPSVQTQPFDARAVRAAIVGALPPRVQGGSEAPGGAPPVAVAESPGAIAETQNFDGRVVRARITGMHTTIGDGEGGGPGSVASRGKAGLPPPASPGEAPTMPFDTSSAGGWRPVGAGEAPTRPFDPSSVRRPITDEQVSALDGSRVSDPGATAPFLRSPLAGRTTQLDAGEAPTGPFNYAAAAAAAVDRAETKPLPTAGGGEGATRPNVLHGTETRPQGLVGGRLGDALEDLPTIEFDRVRPDERLATGQMGSVPGGPLIFRLEAPEPLPTETGSVPTPVILDATGEHEASRLRRALASGAAESPAGLSPDTLAEYDPHAAATDRPGVYRLPPLQTGETPRRVVALPTLGTEEITAWRNEQTAGEEALGARAVRHVRPGAGGGTQPARAAVGGRTPGAGRGAGGGAGGRVARAAPSWTPSPLVAGLASLVFPGLGQAYNGQRDRGLVFALSAPLVLPWLVAIFDAMRVAGQLRSGELSPPLSAAARGSAIRQQLALNLSLIVGLLGGLYVWQTVRGVNAARVGSPVGTPAVASPGGALDAGVSGAGVGAGAETGAADAGNAERLFASARSACGQGNYIRCEALLEAVLAVAPEHADAALLLSDARARARRQAIDPRARPPGSE